MKVYVTELSAARLCTAREPFDFNALADKMGAEERQADRELADQLTVDDFQEYVRKATAAAIVDPEANQDRNWVVAAYRGGQFVVVPGVFTRAEAKRWLIAWDGPELVYHAKLASDNGEVYAQQIKRKCFASSMMLSEVPA